MCQMSMKLPAKFDQNPPHTFHKNVKKLITTKTLCKKIGEKIGALSRLRIVLPKE